MLSRPQIALIGLASIASLNLLACSSDDPSQPPPAEDVLLEPPAEGQGVQYAMVTKLDPGTEAEHCKFVQAPPEGMFVNRDEVRFSKGSHHVLLYETAYTQIPTQKDDGTPVDTSGVFDCSDGATNGFEVTKLIGGSQNATGSAFLDFPSDVAVRVEPGRVLLLNAHYINATSGPLEPEVRVNLYTIPEADVKQQGDILFWYNPFIKVGAKSTGRARMRCMIHQDVTVGNVQSHMHARGVGYAAAVRDEDPFYTNTAWENVPVMSFDDGMKLAKGTWLDYYCDYNNAGSNDVLQGPRSTDEMCMLIGSYYPKDDLTGKCAAEVPNQGVAGNLGAEWVGNGKATCGETFSCVQQSLISGEKTLAGMTTCMLASDPSVSKEMSDAVRCLLMNGQAAHTACKTEFDACLAK